MNEQAKKEVAAYKKLTKEQVFSHFCRTLGRIHNASIKEQRKSWMIYDIIRAKYGAVTADLVA